MADYRRLAYDYENEHGHRLIDKYGLPDHTMLGTAYLDGAMDVIVEIVGWAGKENFDIPEPLAGFLRSLKDQINHEAFRREATR